MDKMDMRTSQSKTFEALKKFTNEEGMVDEYYLNGELILLIHNDRNLWEAVKNRRIRPHSVAWRALTMAANSALEGEYGAEEYYASSAQLKNWLNRFGMGYDSIAETVSEVEELRRVEA